MGSAPQGGGHGLTGSPTLNGFLKFMNVGHHRAIKPGKLIEQGAVDDGIGVNQLRADAEEFGDGSFAELRVAIVSKNQGRAKRLKLVQERTAIGENEAERKRLRALPGAQEAQQEGLGAG